MTEVNYRQEIKDKLLEKELYLFNGLAPEAVLDEEQIKAMGYSVVETLTGMNRQRLYSAKTRGMSVGAAMKLAMALGRKVEDLFVLTEDAWIVPYHEDGKPMYLDCVTGEIVQNDYVAQSKYKGMFYDFKKKVYLSKSDMQSERKIYLENYCEENPSLGKRTAERFAAEAFDNRVLQVFQKLGKKHEFMLLDKGVLEGSE